MWGAVRSRAGAVEMPETLTAWQVEFCAACEGTRWVGEFQRMRGARLDTGVAVGEDMLQ